METASINRKSVSGKKNLLLIQRNLSEKGIRSLLDAEFTVGVVESASLAIERLQNEFKADVVLAEADLLKENNYFFITALKSITACEFTPVVLFCSSAEKEMCVRGLERGANDYVLEPFSAYELKVRLNTQLQLAASKKGARASILANDQLDMLFEQAPVAIALLQGPDFVYTLANPMYLKIFNRKKSRLIGRTVKEAFSEAKADTETYDLFQQAYTTGKPYFRSSSRIIFDRSNTGVPEAGYFDFLVQPVKDTQGKPGGLMIVAIETTAQVTATARLKASKEEHRFLSEATKLLSEIQDYKKMLKALAALAVPQICDYCFIDLISDDGELERVAGAHKDESRREEFETVYEFAPPREKLHPVNEVIASGEPLVQQLDEKLYHEMALSPRHLRFMEKFAVQSLMIYPLKFRGMKLGAFTFCSSAPDKSFSEYDKRLAGELAERVSIAVYNSHLFEQATKEIETRKAAEKALKKSESRFRKMADTAPIMTWLTQPDGNCIYLNRRWYETTGQKAKHGLNHGWLAAVHPEEVKMVEQSFRLANARKEPWRLSMRIRNRSGEYRWYLDTGIPRWNSKGMFEGFIGAVVDIHEQKLAEENLRDRERKLSLSIAAGKIGIWDKDFETNITTLSHELQAIFGYEPGSFNSKNNNEIHKTCTHPEDVPEVVRYFKSVFRRKKKEFSLEFRIIRPDGKIAWIAEKGTVEYRNSRPRKMYGTCIDITQRKFLEQQKDDFLSIASHELKTPVTSIKGRVQLLEEVLKKDSNLWAASQLKKVDMQIDKLVMLITDLLDVTKIQAGKLEFNNQLFDIDKLVTEVVKSMHFVCRKHQLIKTGASGKKVWADRHRIEQVLINLISNATKYSPGADRVSIHTEVKGERVVVRVQDYGVGIPPNELTKVFGRFYRIKGRKYNSSGLGLGLYISAEIIHQQNGKIWAESNPGEGATFSFSLPVATSPAS